MTTLSELMDAYEAGLISVTEMDAIVLSWMHRGH